MPNMSRLIFAYVLKGINDEYGTHSKEDGEVVLNTIRKENFFQGTSTNILKISLCDKSRQFSGL